MEKKTKVRFNLIISLTYILGIVLLGYLFNMQIIKGEYYKEIGNTRLIKKANIESARGKILDRNGIIYANTVPKYKVEIFRTKIDDEKFNKMALILMKILEENNEEYIKKFPIDIQKLTFINLNKEEITKWKKDLNLPLKAGPEECFLRLKEKYNVNVHENVEALKILELREAIRTNPDVGVAPTIISDNIKRKTAIKIIENSQKMPGVNIGISPIRKYEKKEEASHIIGYIAPISDKEYQNNKEKGYGQKDKIGKNGIEKTFENILRGNDGTKHIEMNVEGNVTGEYILNEPKDGANVILTIDSELQKKTEIALKRHLENLRKGKFQKPIYPKGASAIVMDVKNGNILSMVSYPEYEPQKFIDGISTNDWNEYINSPLNPLVNRSLQGTYSPASTFKMSTGIAALDTGKLKVNEGIVCKGKYPKYHKPVCWIYQYGMTHGWQNVTLAIKNSCNYFFYEVGDRLGAEKIAEYARYFGLGRKTGIEIIGEEQGTLATKEVAAQKGQTWNPGDPLSAAIGQSYNSFTPIQMARYISMLANGGKEIHPTVIKSIINGDGAHLSRDEIKKISNEVTGYKEEKIDKKEFKKEHMNAVRQGMYLVTQYGGTAYNTFGNYGVKVGAKTGTAEAGNDINGVFVSFAPFDNPEIAIVVVVENGHEGNYTAEVVREIYSEYFGMNRKTISEKSDVKKEGEFILN